MAPPPVRGSEVRWRRARINRVTASVRRGVDEDLERVRLRLGERGRNERLRIKIALGRILNEFVLDAIGGVAGGEDGRVDLGNHVSRDVGVQKRLGVLVAPQLRMVVHVWRAGDHAVVIVRIAHGLHQAHMTAPRTAVEIGPRHLGGTVVARNESLRRAGRLMRGAIEVVDDLRLVWAYLALPESSLRRMGSTPRARCR